MFSFFSCLPVRWFAVFEYKKKSPHLLGCGDNVFHPGQTQLPMDKTPQVPMGFSKKITGRSSGSTRPFRRPSHSNQCGTVALKAEKGLFQSILERARVLQRRDRSRLTRDSLLFLADTCDSSHHQKRPTDIMIALGLSIESFRMSLPLPGETQHFKSLHPKRSHVPTEHRQRTRHIHARNLEPPPSAIRRLTLS